MDLRRAQSDYIDAWTATMLDIWREKVERLRIIRTGTFHESFSSQVQSAERGSNIHMRFAQYGIYQALGVGNGYTRGNGGDLEILDKTYRQEHGLDRPRRAGSRSQAYISSGEPRARRDWFSKKLYMSRMALAEDLVAITGQEAAAVVCDALEDARNAL